MNLSRREEVGLPDEVTRKVFASSVSGKVEESGEVRVVGEGGFASVLGETERAFGLHVLNCLNEAVSEGGFSVVVPDL